MAENIGHTCINRGASLYDHMKFISQLLSSSPIILLLVLIGVHTASVHAQALEFVKDLSAYNYYNADDYKSVINNLGETYIGGVAASGNCAQNTSGRFVTKLDANRNCVWSNQFTVVPSSGVNSLDVLNIVLDNSGNVIVQGRIYHTTTTSTTYSVTLGGSTVSFPACNDDYTSLNFLFKINSSGTVSWGKAYYENATLGNPDGFRYFESITCDASNSIYLAGEMPDLVYDGAVRTTTAHGNLVVLKISATGAYNSLVAQSVSAGGGGMYSPKIIFNNSSSRLFLVADARTQGNASGGFAFANGATFSNSTADQFGLYFASLSTSLSVQSQAFYKTTDWAFIGNYRSDLVNSGDSIIYLNELNPVSGSLTVGSTVITGDPANYKIVIMKLSATTPSSSAWVRQTVRTVNDRCYLERGGGDQVFMVSSSYQSIDFGNSVQLFNSSATHTKYLLQFKASNGNSDWLIKIPSTNVGATPELNYSSFNSNLYLQIFSCNINAAYYENAIYTLNRKLVINSITAASTLCPGASVSASFTSTQTPTAGNIYTLQLSNEEGRFNTFTNIGTLTSTALTGTITGTIPASLEGSPYMKLRVVASNPSLIGAESKTCIHVATPNNSNATNTIDNSRTANVCDQLNLTMAPDMLYGSTFQWQVNPGSGFVNVTNNATYSGATTGSLTITAASLSLNNYQYKLLVTNSTCPTVTLSENYTVTVKPRPSVVSTTPTSRCDAGTVSLAGAVSAGASVRWYNALTGGTYLGQTNPFTTASISATTTYYADAYLNGCYAFNRMPLLATVYNTPTVSSPAVSRCGDGTVSLVATSGGAVNWYAASTGGSSLFTGLTYTTPSLSISTTYYAGASANGCTTATRLAVPVTIYTAPVVAATGNARCDNGVLNLTAGTNVGTIRWYTASTGGTAFQTGTSYAPNLTATTTYYLDAFTANCTTASRTPIVAMVTPTPTISAVANGSLCGPGKVLLGATPTGGTINWYTASTGGSPLATALTYETVSLSSNATYYAEAVHNGCIYSTRSPVTASIFTPATFSLSKTNPSACGNSDGTIVVSGLNPFSFYNVAYNGNAATTLPSNGSGVITISGLPAGGYSNFTVTTPDNCSTVNIAGQTLSDPSAPFISSTTPASKCDDGGLTLQASASGGTINWYDQPTGGFSVGTGGSFNTPNLTQTTVYYVEASAGSCLSGRTAVTATINKIPTFSGSTPASRCGNGDVSLGASFANGVVSWFNVPSGGTALFTGNTFVTPTLSTNTTYYVEATNNGCTSVGARQNVVATINPIPTVAAVNANSRCGEGSVDLNATASAGATINWYSSSTGGTSLSSASSFTTSYLTNTTSYYAEAIQNGCVSTSRTEVVASVFSVPEFSLTKSDASACQASDGSFTIAGLMPSEDYMLAYDAVSGQPFSTDGAGAYTVSGLTAKLYNGITVTDANNCSAVPQLITISEPPGPAIDAGAAQTVCQGETVTLTADNPDNAALSWSTGETSTSINFTAAGSNITYYTVLANLLGCISKDSVAVKVRSDQSINTFPQIADQNVLSNPFTISATSTSSLPVSFTSLDPFVATVSGDQITIVGPGIAIIQASQAGNNCFNPANDTAQTFVVSGKLNQQITFPALPVIAFGDAPLSLGATVNSMNAVLYEVTDSDIVEVTNGMAVGKKAGTTSIKAYALGTATHNPSDTVVQSLTVIIPNFRIFGGTIVQANSKEEYFVSPTGNQYNYSWKYEGTNTYFVSDTNSAGVSLFFNENAHGDSLRCRVHSIAANTFVDVWTSIKVIPANQILTPVDCDSIVSSQNSCSGRYVHSFVLSGEENSLSNQQSGCNSGYSDFSRLSGNYTTSLYLGEIYAAEISVGNSSGQSGTVYAGLWIDYNNNGDFTDPDEFLLSTFSEDSTIELKNIRISTNNNYSGVKRLRLRIRSSGLFSFDESCLSYNQSGETEDYQVTLLAPDQLEAPVLLTPNDDGKNDFFVIKGIITNESTNKLTILDRTGTVLYSEQNYSNDWNGTDNNEKRLPNDTYYYNFVNGDGNSINGYFEIRY